MPLYRLSTLIGLICFSASSFAQNSAASSSTSEVWPQYYLQLPVKNKWSVSSDFSNRYSGFFAKKAQWIGRVGLEYKLKQNLALSAGYAYAETFTSVGVRRENRPWQQVQLNSSGHTLKLNHRLRLEERFQKDKNLDRFNYRVRYQIMLTAAIKPGERLSLYVSDEPMVNFGKEITGQMFDQNRLQLGLQIKLVDNVFLSPAFMYTYQYQQSTKEFRDVDIVRTGLIYRR